MKWAVSFLAVALLVLVLPSGAFADDGTSVPATQQESAQTEESENILDKIIDAATELLGLDDGDSDEPLENVHPPDWNPPTDGPEGDDGGWDEAR